MQLDRLQPTQALNKIETWIPSRSPEASYLTFSTVREFEHGRVAGQNLSNESAHPALNGILLKPALQRRASMPATWNRACCWWKTLAPKH